MKHKIKAFKTWRKPEDIANLLEIDADKVTAWIRSGQLTAVNVAERAGGRPRWRIEEKEFEAFLLRRRSNSIRAPATRRKRGDPNVTKFY